MKRIVTLMGIVLFFFPMVFPQKYKKCRGETKYSYIQRDNIHQRDYILLQLPMHWSCLDIVVKDANSATAIAYIYATNIYGEEVAKLELPYNVCLVNDSVWHVGGTNIERDKHPTLKGSFDMLIHKRTGELLFYMHEK